MTQLDYGQLRRRWWHLPRWFVIVLAAAIALPILAVLMLSSRFSYTSICPVCGDVEHASEWKIPFTDWTYFTSKSTQKTLLSAALAKQFSTTATHKHDWQFATGGGNGVRCALGDGRYLWEIANQGDVAAFVDATLSYGDAGQRGELLSLMQDRDRIIYLRQAIGWARFPEHGIANAAEYKTWCATNQKMWDDWWRDSR